MFKKKFLYILSLFLVIFITMTTLNARAHNPSNMSLSYNSTTDVLSVTITHTVADPTSHYIKSVEIKVNGSTTLNQLYTSQPTTSTFTYQYNITVADGATIQATASCSIAGSITRSITIGEDSGGEGTTSNISGYTSILLLIGISVVLLLPIIYKKTRRGNK